MIYQSLNENPFGIKYPNSGLHCCTKITSMFKFLNDAGSWTSSKTATNKKKSCNYWYQRNKKLENLIRKYHSPFQKAGVSSDCLSSEVDRLLITQISTTTITTATATPKTIHKGKSPPFFWHAATPDIVSSLQEKWPVQETPSPVVLLSLIQRGNPSALTVQ